MYDSQAWGSASRDRPSDNFAVFARVLGFVLDFSHDHDEQGCAHAFLRRPSARSIASHHFSHPPAYVSAETTHRRYAPLAVLSRSSLDRSVILEIDLSGAPSTENGLDAAKEAWLPASRVGSLGWEPNAGGRPGPRMSDLSSVLDPSRLAENSVRLNIKLMRWRALPELDVELLARTKCLLLGAGERGGGCARGGVFVVFVPVPCPFFGFV